MTRISRFMRVCAGVFLLAYALLHADFVDAQTTGFTTVASTALKLGGFKISTGTVSFTPVDKNGVLIPAFVDGGGGQNGGFAFQCQITAGVIGGMLQEDGTYAGTCLIPDATLTIPVNILYSIQVTDTSTGTLTGGKTYTLQQVAGLSGSTWALDHYGPAANTTNIQNIQFAQGTTTPTSCIAPYIFTNMLTQVTSTCIAGAYVSLATGPVGASINPRGGWAASTSYAKLDTYTYLGSSYMVTAPYTSGVSFGSTDTANTQVLAAAGANGTTTPDQAQTSADTSVNKALPTSRNLFNPANVIASKTYASNANALVAWGNTGGEWSGNIPVIPGATYTWGNVTVDNNSVHGAVFFDVNGNPITSSFVASTSQTNPMTVVAPTNAHSFGFALYSSNTTAMMVQGSALPSLFVPWDITTISYAPGLLNLQAAIPTLPSSPAAIQSAVETVVDASGPLVRNLYDPARAQNGACWSNVTNGIRTSYFSNGLGWSGFIPVVSSQTYTLVAPNYNNNSECVAAFFDVNHNPITSTYLPMGSITANQQFTAPANAAYFAFPLKVTAPAPAWNAQTETRAQLVKGTTIPTTYLPFTSATFPLPTPQTRSPWAGLRMGIFGDSYCGFNEYQQRIAFAHGMSITFQDCRTNRPWGPNVITNGNGGSPFECWGGTATGAFTPSLNPGNWETCAAASPGSTSGELLSAALANVDVLLLPLGTNNYNDTIGSITDTTSTASTHGYIKAIITGLQQNYPTLRLIMITPVNIASRAPGLANVAQAMIQEGQLYGVPVIDNFTNSIFNTFNTTVGTNAPAGLCNAGTSAGNATILMQGDGIHPTVAVNNYGSCGSGIGMQNFAAYPILKMFELAPWNYQSK